MTTFLQTKEDITVWLEKHQVKNYELMVDEKYGFVVNVHGDVDVSGKNLSHIPVKFSHVGGNFKCNNNQLTSLEFCPSHVESYFSCYNNKLISLIGAPEVIKGYFDCDCNQLTSLIGCPQYVGGSFDCGENQLTSLEFCPVHVGGSFMCGNNPLLQEIQEIIDFNLIYQEHVKTKILLAKKQLESIINKELVSFQETAKFKI